MSLHLKNLKKLSRFKDIISVLAKYGFDELLGRLDLPGSSLIRKVKPVDKEMGTYERIRCAMEDLGPTFIKFGQILSLRPDLLPKDFLHELEKLQDDVPAADFSKIEAIIESSLGHPIKEVFSVFDVKPIAVASLSQVHRAVLHREGSIVAVKIQRPNVEKMVTSDLDVLENFAVFLDNRMTDLKPYNLPNLVNVVRRTLVKEINFEEEARNMKIAATYAAETDIYIPEVIETYCSSRLLVMEYVNGTKYNNVSSASQIDGRAIARQGLRAAIKQTLEDGFFHADPHPGNLLVTDDMNLCIIDWGMVGRLTEKDRFELIDFLVALVDKDSEALVTRLLRLCHTSGRMIRVRALERDLLEILDTHYALPIKDINIAQLLLSITSLIRHHSLELRTDLLVMIKALVTAEGSARQLYPEMDAVAEIRDYVTLLAKRRYRPETMVRNLRHFLSNTLSGSQDLPMRIQRIIVKMERGELGFQFQLEKIEHLMKTLENSSNRLTVGIITGAIIMGSSMIITTGIGPHLFGYPALGVIGYLLSVILGLWLIVTILRNRKY